MAPKRNNPNDNPNQLHMFDMSDQSAREIASSTKDQTEAIKDQTDAIKDQTDAIKEYTSLTAKNIKAIKEAQAVIESTKKNLKQPLRDALRDAFKNAGFSISKGSQIEDVLKSYLQHNVKGMKDVVDVAMKQLGLAKGIDSRTFKLAQESGSIDPLLTLLASISDEVRKATAKSSRIGDQLSIAEKEISKEFSNTITDILAFTSVLGGKYSTPSKSQQKRWKASEKKVLEAKDRGEANRYSNLVDILTSPVGTGHIGAPTTMDFWGYPLGALPFNKKYGGTPITKDMSMFNRSYADMLTGAMSPYASDVVMQAMQGDYGFDVKGWKPRLAPEIEIKEPTWIDEYITKSTKSLVKGLAKLPVFKQVSNLANDWMRLKLYQLASNKNLPTWLRKSALSASFLQGPETLTSIAGGLADTGLGMFADYTATKLAVSRALPKDPMTSASKGRLGKFKMAGGLGIAALAGNMLISGAQGGIDNSAMPNWAKTTLGTGLGIAGGALTGAAAGSLIGPVGTVVGAVLGGLIGGGSELLKHVKNIDENTAVGNGLLKGVNVVQGAPPVVPSDIKNTPVSGDISQLLIGNKTYMATGGMSREEAMKYASKHKEFYGALYPTEGITVSQMNYDVPYANKALIRSLYPKLQAFAKANNATINITGALATGKRDSKGKLVHVRNKLGHDAANRLDLQTVNSQGVVDENLNMALAEFLKGQGYGGEGYEDPKSKKYGYLKSGVVDVGFSSQQVKEFKKLYNTATKEGINNMGDISSSKKGMESLSDTAKMILGIK